MSDRKRKNLKKENIEEGDYQEKYPQENFVDQYQKMINGENEEQYVPYHEMPYTERYQENIPPEGYSYDENGYRENNYNSGYGPYPYPYEYERCPTNGTNYAEYPPYMDYQSKRGVTSSPHGYSMVREESPESTPSKPLDSDSYEEKKTKRCGRQKITMKYIPEKCRRSVTFSKRKKGIMKKAFELNVLTGTQVLLLVASESGHVYTFATPKLKPIISNHERLIQQCLNAPCTPEEENYSFNQGDENMRFEDKEKYCKRDGSHGSQGYNNYYSDEI
ncbi:serum response factor homolog B-like [Nylanderia fulva]|uniref:serum response factor homolog B-like n=1 Tax=Nylanderia fulva TaxID=613905 RepID=UPI0010FAE859|nr:serum response factor homolog B-like [Nylanderia fulva]XP_029162489.1 serum response factor homolog B-like [Nylanderia fulva]